MKFKFYFRKSSFKKDLDSAYLLLSEIEKYKPNNFLEVGVYQGVTSRNVTFQGTGALTQGTVS